MRLVHKATLNEASRASAKPEPKRQGPDKRARSRRSFKNRPGSVAAGNEPPAAAFWSAGSALQARLSVEMEQAQGLAKPPPVGERVPSRYPLLPDSAIRTIRSMLGARSR
jgi:hypothetical protein